MRYELSDYEWSIIRYGCAFMSTRPRTRSRRPYSSSHDHHARATDTYRGPRRPISNRRHKHAGQTRAVSHISVWRASSRHLRCRL